MAAVEKLCRAAPPSNHPAAVLLVESLVIRPSEFYPVAIVFGYGDDNADRAKAAGERLTSGPQPQGFRVRLCSR